MRTAAFGKYRTIEGFMRKVEQGNWIGTSYDTRIDDILQYVDDEVARFGLEVVVADHQGDIVLWKIGPKKSK